MLRLLNWGQRRNSYVVIQVTKSFKTESIRKLSNFNFQRTKTLYQINLNDIAFFCTSLNGERCKNCENTSKILKISCLRYHFVKFDISILGLSYETFFGVITDNLLHLYSL